MFKTVPGALAALLLLAPQALPLHAHANTAAPADKPELSAIVPAYVLVNADRRDTLQSLSGPWHYSVDPYRDGLADFLGRPANARLARGSDINVQEAEKADPNALFEYDLRQSPVGPVPSAWMGYDPTLRYYNGLMWYQKSFDRAPTPAGKRVFLRFGAAEYKATVYLNGQLLGEHEGGFTPFSFDITNVLREKDNNLVVAVDSVRTADTIPPTVTDWETYGGITRDVLVIETPATFIDDDFVHLSKDGRILADVALEGANKAGQAVEVSVEGTKLSLRGTTDAQGRVSLSAPAPKGLKLWSPDSPTLYAVTVKTAADHLSDRIGFRTIETRGEKILLNGKPIFLSGISLHEEEFGANPARILTPEASRALLSEIKYGLHGNYVRLSHYPHSEVTTRMADELGLLVWSEIPVYWSVKWDNPATQKVAQKMIAENILRDRNRASIVLWSVGNETPVSDARNAFLTALAKEARGLDGTRLISAALLTDRKIVDGHIDMTIEDPLVAQLDVMAVNTYNGWYGNDKIEDVPATQWHSTWNKPLILSEFGADAQYGYHNPAMPRFSEEYQAKFFTNTLAMADKIPYLAGMSPWILKDFRSPRRQNVFQKGWNRKGLVSETGQRKMAFKVLADYYAQRSKK